MPLRSPTPILLLLAAVTASTSASAQDTAGGAGGATRPMQSGEQVYRQVCQACHMADGKGATGAATFPALAGNVRLSAAAYPITMVLNGRGAMPALGSSLKPEQVAAVVGYVRTHFGNAYAEPVTAADVRAVAGPDDVPEIH